jgi:hypothetical protein
MIHSLIRYHNPRFAIELGLNQEAPPMLTEQEKLNRTRTWLNCYCVDLSHAIQYGKMPILRVDDYVAQNSRNWYNSSPNNLPIDIHLCAYVEMLSIAAEFHTEKQRQVLPNSSTSHWTSLLTSGFRGSRLKSSLSSSRSDSVKRAIFGLANIRSV